MKRLLCAFLIGGLAACSGRAASPRDDSASGIDSQPPGSIVVPTDSPMLKQIARQAARLTDLPVDDLTTPGKIEANPNRITKIAAPVAGRVVQVLVKTGDSVKQDQPLLTLRSPDADAATATFLASQASVSQTQAALSKAQADFDRLRDLFDHDAVARKEVLSAENGLIQAKAAVQQAQAARDQATRRLAGLGLTTEGTPQEVILRSPLAGKVLELTVVAGEFRNDTTVSLMTIADLASVFITSQVPETYIRFVRPGQRVDIALIAFPGDVFAGRVARIADTVDPQTRTVKVQAEIENPDGRLRPEMYGTVHHVQATSPLLVVPSTAIVDEGDRTVALVEVTPGHFEQRDVAVTRRIGELAAVGKGLKRGDVVVTDGALLLKMMVSRAKVG
jgi:cobalt-zinc-cadmium efflux system membrane fusion protein